MSNIIIGALAAAPVTFLAWTAYNWMGKPILDVRLARIGALKRPSFTVSSDSKIAWADFL